MMLSLSIAFVVLVIIGINGQPNDLNAFRSNSPDNNHLLGKIRVTANGRNEELVSYSDSDKSPVKPEQSPAGVQPLPSPCTATRLSNKIAHPRDKTKYIQCRDDFHYEIFSCPNGGDFNDQIHACNIVSPMFDTCQHEKPCLNDGQCSLLSNSTFKCTCQADWTGDRCETALNSCVKKPCGPNAECRPLVTSDYQQDYICICNARKEYGLNCQEVVPNPCIISSDQFFPFAFSQRLYIQCDGELMFFQPCGPLLYWNQDGKLCDRKRSNTVDSKAMLAKLMSNRKVVVQSEPIDDESVEEFSTAIPTTLSSTTTTEQPRVYVQRPRMEVDRSFAFVPARIVSRPAAIYDQQVQNLRDKEQQIPEGQNQVVSSVDSNQIRAKQWPQQTFYLDNQPLETTIRQPASIIQAGRNPQWPQNMQPQRIEPSVVDQSQRDAQLPVRIEQQQPDLTQPTQPVVYQQWSNQPSTFNTQNKARLPAQPQSVQGSPIVQTQSWPLDQNPALLLETTTAVPSVFRLQGFQNANTREYNSNAALPNNVSPQTADVRTQNMPINAGQSKPWQNSQSLQNQPQFAANLPETTTPENRLRFNTDISNQQQWQAKGNNAVRSNFAVQPEQSTFELGRTRSDNQPWAQGQNPGILVETSTVAQNMMRPQGFQMTNTREQGQVRSNQFNTQQTQNEPSLSQSFPTFGFQPKLLQEQDNTLKSQSWTQKQTKQPFMNELSASQNQNSQFGFNQQQRIQGNQYINGDDSRKSTDGSFTVRPNSQSFGNQQQLSNNQLMSNSIETTTFTNTAVAQGGVMQNFNGWQAVQTVNQRQPTNNPMAQQTFEQRRTPDSMPGSWKMRS